MPAISLAMEPANISAIANDIGKDGRVVQVGWQGRGCRV
jgi:hypothetical protein